MNTSTRILLFTKKKGSHRSHSNEEQIEYIVRVLTFLFFFFEIMLEISTGFVQSVWKEEKKMIAVIYERKQTSVHFTYYFS